MDEQTRTTQETTTNPKGEQENSTNTNAEQTPAETGGQPPREENTEHVDFAQMYDMLTERDNTIKTLKSEIADLKKTNTNLLLKVNAAPSGSGVVKNPYESFIDNMVNR